MYLFIYIITNRFIKGLGINIIKALFQKRLFLIKSILKDLNLTESSNSRALPALTTHILRKHEDSPPHSEPWHYRSVVGKLNYLEKSSEFPRKTAIIG